MSILHIATALLACLEFSSALKTPRQLNRREILSLEDAILNAAKISCDDPNFKEPDKSTPEYRWTTSRARDLLAAIAYHWGEYGETQNYAIFSAYVASVAGLETTDFHCDDISVDNACSKYTSNCVSFCPEIAVSSHLTEKEFESRASVQRDLD